MPVTLAFAPHAPLWTSARNHHCSPRRLQSHTTAIVILGGSSGVGLEAANHLRLLGKTVTSFSRRTGHDLTDPTVASAVLSRAMDGLAISVGAGRRSASREDELYLYYNIIQGLATTLSLNNGTQVGLVVAVARSLILSEVRRMLTAVPNIDWVIVRPGALVDVDARRRAPLEAEDLFVTADPRCNGLVSRHAAGVVVAGLLMGRVPHEQIVGQTLGIYDRNRMNNHPKDAPEIGSDALWVTAPAVTDGA